MVPWIPYTPRRLGSSGRNQTQRRALRSPGSHGKMELKPSPLPPHAKRVLPHIPDTWLLFSSRQRMTYSFSTPGQVLSRDGVQSTDTESGPSVFTDMCCGLPTTEAATSTIVTVNSEFWLSTSTPALST